MERPEQLESGCCGGCPMNDWFEAEQRVERAQQLSESHCFAEALAELDVALSINPNNALWHAQRGYLLEELDRTADAVEAYRRSLQLESGDQDVSLALGTALWGDITTAAFGPPDGKANVLDIPAVTNKLKGVTTFFSEPRTWLKQRDPAADVDAITVIDLSDVQDGVLAKPYPASRTIDACPHD